MTVIKDGAIGDAVFDPHAAEVVPSGETGTWIFVRKGATVSCIPAGTARLEYTTSLPREVREDTAEEIPWARGDVTAKTSEVVDVNITAVRVVSVSGEAKIEVVQ